MIRITPLLLLLTTTICVESFASNEADPRGSLRSTATDPGSFHYGMMQNALSHGNVQTASQHARIRTQFLTLTYRPFSYIQVSAKRQNADSIILDSDPPSEKFQLEHALLKAREEAKIIKLPLEHDFSEEIGKMLEENEDSIQSLAAPPE